MAMCGWAEEPEMSNTVIYVPGDTGAEQWFLCIQGMWVLGTAERQDEI